MFLCFRSCQFSTSSSLFCNLSTFDFCCRSLSCRPSISVVDHLLVDLRPLLSTTLLIDLRPFRPWPVNPKLCLLRFDLSTQNSALYSFDLLSVSVTFDFRISLYIELPLYCAFDLRYLRDSLLRLQPANCDDPKLFFCFFDSWHTQNGSVWRLRSLTPLWSYLPLLASSALHRWLPQTSAASWPISLSASSLTSSPSWRITIYLYLFWAYLFNWIKPTCSSCDHVRMGFWSLSWGFWLSICPSC